MMNDKNIDDLFRDKLKDLEKAPPAYLLGNILSGAAAARRRRRLMYWRVASVAAGLLLAFVAGWQINEFNSRSEKQTIVLHPNTTEQSHQGQEPVQSTETLSTSSTQAKVADPETGTSTQKKQLAHRTIPSAVKDSMEEVAVVGSESSVEIITVQAISGQIDQKEQFATVMEEKKEEPIAEEKTVPSVDQQIIEQNVQAMQARDENRKKKRWLVGAQLSPAVSVNRSSHSQQYASNMLSSSNSSPVDLGAGLTVEFKAGKRWSVQSGIYYAGLEQSSGNMASAGRGEYADADKGAEYFNAPVNIEVGKMQMNSTAGVIEFKSVPVGVVVGNSIEDKTSISAVMVTDARFIQNFQFVEIPLYLRYTLLDARFDVELMGGVSSNVLVGNDTFMDSSSGKSNIGRTQDMQDISYSGALGLGLKYGLSKRVFLNLEPRVKYYLNSLNNNPQVEYKPYTIGMFTGISYSF